MPEKTGKPFGGWVQIIDDAGLEKHGEIMKLLKGEFGVTHSYANTISILYRQRAAGGPPEADQLVKAQYAGPKTGLIDIYEAVRTAVSPICLRRRNRPEKELRQSTKEQAVCHQPAVYQN